MNRSGYGKILAAFTAGLGLALGGAVLYVRMAGPGAAAHRSTQYTTTQAAAQLTPDNLPDAGREQPPPAAEPETVAPEVPESQAPGLRPKDRAVKKVAGAAVMPARKKASDRSLVAQAKPQPYLPSPPPDDPAPAPAAEATPAPSTPPPAPADTPSASSAAPVAAPEVRRQPRTITLQSGTRLVVRLNQEVSSERAAPGDGFTGTLETPIVVDNALIAEKGSHIRGEVVSAQRGGRGSGAAELSLAVTEINTTDGQRVSVETSSYRQQGSRNARGSAEKIGGGAALGAIIGAIAGGGKGAAIGAGAGGAAGGGAVLLGRAKPAVVASETKLDFQLIKSVAITEKLN